MTTRGTLVAAVSAAVLATGLMAGCAPTAEPGADDSSAPAPLVTCVAGERVEGDITDWVHPTESFYAPGAEDVPDASSLEHLLVRDNALVIRYSSSLPTASLASLEAWVVNQVATVAVPDHHTQHELTAWVGNSELVCDGVDTVQIAEFAGGRVFGGVEEHGEGGHTQP